jgi:probable biosynthetic protein (TIGR04099 family)
VWQSTSRIRLGMPALDAGGLSERWLQASCGERHWRGLAELLGRPSRAWADAQGRRVYAAFGLLRMTGADLSAAHEGAVLAIDTRLAQPRRAQAWSHHRLRCGGRTLAELEMLSVFVSRTQGHSNRSVRRADIGLASGEAPPEAMVLVDHARSRRQADMAVPASAPSWVCRPCPRGDFNGAGLLYFPSFSVLIDRALWAWGRLDAGSRITARECLFVGNIEIGESIRIRLAAEQRVGTGRELALQITGADDGRLLARSWLSVAAATDPCRGCASPR